MIDASLRDLACPALAVLLVVAGTLATGLLPGTPPYQAVAGGIVVAGFAVLFVCLGDETLLD